MLLLILLSPLALVTALLVKLTSRGPILFVQERTGLSGHPFALLKFRTMRADRIPDPAEIVPLDHTDVTRVGRFLRRFKIDEMPQLIQVLTGHMSLVGPRPTLPDQTDAYDDFRRQRLLVRPGITGLAQIHGNTALSWDQRILFDIAYVRRCGPVGGFPQATRYNPHPSRKPATPSTSRRPRATRRFRRRTREVRLRDPRTGWST